MPGTTPSIIQGGMGVGVSSWQLARSVARAGHLGVVSGTALDATLARRLQDGDPDGHARRALAAFPDQAMVARALDRYHLPEGRTPGRPYRPTPKPSLRPSRHAQELAVLGNFAEVWLAKQGHEGTVGINFLEKIQLATPAAALGAMLAGVDVVLMGAGVPREIPQLLTDLARGEVGGIGVDVHGAPERSRIEVDPKGLLGRHLPPLRRPRFLAIVSATVLAAYLARDDATRPDGFVIEGPVAGGHNAPPRGTLVVDDDGEPVYGDRDAVDLAKVAALGLPFWLAGGHGTPEGLQAARAAGAAGIQVGTLFALAAESGLRPELREQVGAQLGAGTLRVRTDVRSSPTGFPFKVARIEGTLSESEVYEDRERLCDLGYLRTPYLTAAGRIGYRCPGEPVAVYQRKGGDLADTAGRRCLCNALTADVGLGQTRPDGYREPGLITLGSDLSGPGRLLERHPGGWTAGQAVAWLEGR
ncbi:MAG: nitronate monooxygenase [Nocardioides sp.]|nr:nitronate monooxygenase [Nocardioides sp.]